MRPLADVSGSAGGIQLRAVCGQALRGREYSKPAGDGVSRIVFPAVVAAQERVAQNQKFRFDHLAPGRYVIWAQYRAAI